MHQQERFSYARGVCDHSGHAVLIQDPNLDIDDYRLNPGAFKNRGTPDASSAVAILY